MKNKKENTNRVEHELTITITGEQWQDVVSYILNPWHANRLIGSMLNSPSETHFVSGSSGLTAYEIAIRKI